MNSNLPARASGPPSTSFAPGTLSRDALASLVYSGAVRVGALGLSIVAARQLGSAGAGALGVALQVVALGSLAASFNVPYALTQRLARTSDVALRVLLLRASAAVIAVLTLVTVVALMLAAPMLARWLYADASLAPVLIACGPLTLAAAAYLWVEGALQGFRRFGSLARWGVLVAVIDLVIGLVASAWGVVAMLVWRTVLRLVAAAIAALRWLGPIGSEAVHPADGTPRPSLRELAGSLLRFAAPTVAGGAVVLLGNALLRVLLVRSGDLAAAGQFQAADSLAQGITLVPLAAAAAFLPAAAEHASRPEREIAAPLRRAIEQVMGYNLPLCLVAIALAPWVMSNIFGRDFGPSRPVFILLVCAYGVVGQSALFVAWLMGRDRPWIILLMNGLWAVALLLVFQFVTRPWGAAGAAVANVAAYVLAVAGYAGVVAPRYSLPWSCHLPAIAITLAALGCGAALQLAPGVPVGLAVGGNLVMAALVFARWGAPSLAASGLLRRGRP